MKKDFIHAPVEVQTKELIRIVRLNPVIKELLDNLKLPNFHPWYIGAGCVNQTVWNYLTDRDITYSIGDYDVVYWDDDYTREKEVSLENSLLKQFKHLGMKKIDLTNQAGVHKWFHKKFGKKIDQYLCLEHAISTWPATVTCVGVTKKDKKVSVFAPYGLSDIFSMVLRQNRPHAVDRVRKIKFEKWKSKWPELTIIKS